MLSIFKFRLIFFLRMVVPTKVQRCNGRGKKKKMSFKMAETPSRPRPSALNTNGLEGKNIGQVIVKITATEIAVKIYCPKTNASAGGAGAGEGDILYTN